MDRTATGDQIMKRILLTLLGALAIAGSSATAAFAGNLPFAYSAKTLGVAGLIRSCGGSDIATATFNGNTAAQITTTYSYQLDGTGTQWILNVNASAVPVDAFNNPIAPPGINYSSTILNDPRWTWTHQCTISWIEFESNGPVLKSETFSY